MARGGRRRLGVDLSPEAYESWHQYARANGVSVTALLEVIGQMLARKRRPSPHPLRPFITRARAIDAERARNAGRRPSS